MGSKTSNKSTDTGPTAPRGAHTGLLVLTASLAFMLSLTVPTANADERGQAKKKIGSQQLAEGQGRALRESSGGAKGKHREPVEAVECGDVLSKPGRYSLNSDLVCTSPISITDSNVRLDLAGHSIACDEANWAPNAPGERYPQIIAGIFVNAESAVEWELSGGDYDALPQLPPLTGFKVKNGTIADCTFGMYFFRTERSKVWNMDLVGNNVEREEFNFASAGITTFASHNNLFYGNRASGGSLNHFELARSNGNRLMRNVLTDSTDDGIALFGSSDNVIWRNTIAENPYGIYVQPDFTVGLDPSNNNVIAGNKVSGSGEDGITLLGPSSDNVIRGNTVTDSTNGGILLVGLPQFGLPVPEGNTVKGNTAFRNLVGDLAEVDVEFGEEGEVVVLIPDACSNLWKHNKFDTSVGPEDCIE